MIYRELVQKLSWHRGMRARTAREFLNHRWLRRAVDHDAVLVPIQAFLCGVLETVARPVSEAFLRARELFWINEVPQRWDYDSYNEISVWAGTRMAPRPTPRVALG